jgi:DNA-binding HxlR family transcriptional regulator
MRSYHQYCGLAKALDVVGDRWSLLVVRELLVGARRYGELLDGLPGIATNLLADRLRDLRSAGVVERDDEGRYALTAWGEGLAGPVYALGRWAAPLLGRMAEDDTFRGQWLVHPVRAIFGDPDPRRPDVSMEVRADGSPMTLECVNGEVGVRPGAPAQPAVVVSGPPDAIIGLLAGHLDKEAAAARGVAVVGDARLLRKLRPRTAP